MFFENKLLNKKYHEIWKTHFFDFNIDVNDAVNQSESSCSLAPQTLQLSSGNYGQNTDLDITLALAPFQMLDIINLRY